MIHIPVFWTEFNATAEGRNLKFVPCENCSTEYVYVIKRKCLGTGTSMYNLNNEGAASRAQSAAAETLTSVLENDFDPVPCPACGYYQRYMFPKLLGIAVVRVRIVMFAVIAISFLAAVSALHSSVAYQQHPNHPGFEKMIKDWSLLLTLFLAGLGLSIVKNVKIRRFDPNTGDPHTRIAIGQSRAVTRAQFEKAQLAGQPAGPISS